MSVNSSHSRTYLTSSNNPYDQIHNLSTDPNILAERQKRNDQLINHRSTAARSRISPLLKVTPLRASNKNPSQPTYPSLSDIMAETIEDEDIFRMPDSSDEENTHEPDSAPADATATKSTKRKNTSLEKPLGSKDLNTAGTRRSKRRKTSNEDEEESLNVGPSTMPEASSTPLAEIESFLSQIPKSQEVERRKKPIIKYNSSQSALPRPSVTPQKPERTKFKSISRETTPRQDQKNSKRTRSKVKDVSSSPHPTPLSKTNSKFDKIVSSPATEVSTQRAIFQDIEVSDSEQPATSRTTSNTSKSTSSGLFDQPSHKRNRRASSSSLSSVDSLIEYQLDGSQKAALMADASNPQDPSVSTTIIPPDHTLCPICRRSTSLKNLPGYTQRTKPSTLSLRAQTKFCYTHRMRDANVTWKSRSYPSIDWFALPTSASLQKHVEALIPIVRRKAPSYYLSKLDNVITTAKGNISEINRGFNVSTMQYSYGYYGPRGAKIISSAILQNEQLQKILSRQIRSDKHMRVAGIGRLVDCALMPEILVRLIRDDMAILGTKEEGDGKARKVLEESADLGLLLCADDDEVEGDVEGDEGEVTAL